MACGHCPRTCSKRSASSSSDDVLRAALGRTRDEEYVDYYVAREAGGVVPLPRAGERLGGARVPDALLRGLPSPP